jgi:hypothetical protein
MISTTPEKTNHPDRFTDRLPFQFLVAPDVAVQDNSVASFVPKSQKIGDTVPVSRKDTALEPRRPERFEKDSETAGCLFSPCLGVPCALHSACYRRSVTASRERVLAVRGGRIG